MTDVVILGAGGFARETYWVFLEDNEEKKKWNVLGFVDDNPKLHGTELCNSQVLGGFDWLEQNSDKNFEIICGVGNPRSRKEIAIRAASLHLDFCTVVHPSARMSRWVELGAGAIVTAGSTLTTQIKVGPHTIVNLNTTIGHDTLIGAYCNINPGCHISGCVKFGDGVYFGTGAVIIHSKSVGDWSIIGAGAAVGIDIPSHVTAAGVPCRVIKNHELESSIAAGS
ncbi:MAG TPA: acetyltransferase [Candidatus Binatus sp.]|nr:acetyltransferase [Candidatus Binatus sp.]